MKKRLIASIFTLFTLSLSLHAVEMTTAKTAPMKDCTDKGRYPTVRECFSDLDEANHGFTMLHKSEAGQVIKTKTVALLVHGLSDSPYFFRDIAEILFQEGINIVAIRTTGNGTLDTHLKKVRYADWIEDIRYGKILARKYGQKLILGGMSLGGTLMVHDFLYSETPADGLLGFSPTIEMPGTHKWTCFMPWRYEAKKEYGVGVRYQRITNQSTCEVYKLTKELLGYEAKEDVPPQGFVAPYDLERREKIIQKNREAVFNKIDVPLFTVLTEYDGALNMPTVLEYTSKSGSAELGLSHIVMFTKKIDSSISLQNDLTHESLALPVDRLPHASVLLKKTDNDFTPETNPHFEIVERELRKFLRTYFK